MGMRTIRVNSARSKARNIIMEYEETAARLETELGLEKEKVKRLNEQIGKSGDERTLIVERQLRELQSDHELLHKTYVQLQAEHTVAQLDLMRLGGRS